MNIYLKEKLGPPQNYIILNQPWQPIIETKRNKLWESYRKLNCNTQIQDIWNVDVLDFYKGNNGKILRDCSLFEIISETLYQIGNDKYIQNLKSKSGNHFGDLIFDVEIHNFWKEKDGKIITSHPKFSVNAEAKNNLLDYNYPSLSQNLWFAAYYCKPSFKYGASMDNSSFIGMSCARLIYEKYNMNIPSDIEEILNDKY